MIEIIPSKWMRENLRNKKVFTDSEKATLIWNAPNVIWEEILLSLNELSISTSDNLLRSQVLERIAYERKAMMLFNVNFDKEYVYVVIDAERESCGFFADAEMARQYGMKHAKKWEEECFRVEKQLILSEDNKDKFTKLWSSKHNLFKLQEAMESEYTGEAVAGVRYNNAGEILSIYSCEVSNEENDKIDEQKRDRFEYQFFRIPFGMESGTIVKKLQDGEYAVLAGGEKTWNQYMRRTENNEHCYDFSDIQTIVYVLRNDGSWSHEHVNPLFLEVELPEVEEGYLNSAVYVEALCALGEYLKNSTIENNHKALKASRHYAEVNGDAGDPSRVYTADNIEDIMY